MASFVKMRLYTLCIIPLLLSTACGRNETSDKTLSSGKQEHIGTTATSNSDPWTADSLAYLLWGNPASPYRDESRYIVFLDSLLASDSLPEGLRERAEYRRQMAMLNRPGTIASDFRYLERHGRESRLHNLKTPVTILVFYDPECPHCNDILRSFASSKAINIAIAEKKLTVIAIYAEGKRDVWDKTRNDLPENWLVGYDITGVLDEEIYNLPAMPTFYLLDSDKRVILKDPDLKRLIARIAE